MSSYCRDSITRESLTAARGATLGLSVAGEEYSIGGYGGAVTSLLVTYPGK